jgi:hypothetical protein
MKESIMKVAKIIIMLMMALVLFLCLMDMPYSYYQFVRIFCFIGFAALSSMSKVNSWQSLVFGCLAVLFNPVFPIHMDRFVWNFLDVGIAIVLIYLAVKIQFKAKADNL